MRRALAAAAVAGFLIVAPATDGAPQISALPRLDVHSLRYLGSFRLPAPRGSHATFDYGGTALAYDPAHNSLFVVGHDWYQLSAEVSVPRELGHGHVAHLPRARYLQGFADPTGGRLDHTAAGGAVYTGGAGNKIGGQLVYQNRLYGSVYVYYDASGSQVRTLWARSSTSLTRSRAGGLYTLGHQGAGYVSGFMALIPPAWQPLLGGPALTGQCCIPIISRTSFGPAAFSFDPARLGHTGPAPDHPLVYYPQQHPTLGAWNATWNPARGRLFGGGTAIRGIVFPSASRSVLFFGTQGVGRFCYGEGTTNRSLAFKPTPDGTTWCYDPADSSKGTHAYPYVPEVWAYDAAALAEVRTGRRRPWQVKPYATWRLRLPYSSPDIGGAAYDPAHDLVYISQQYVDGAAPVIDVFRVS